MTEANKQITKVVVVTGAGQGIGKAIATHLAGDGYAVVIADIREDVARKSADELANLGYRVAIARTDVSDPESCNQMIASAVKEYGRVDALVNSAGISKPGPSLDVTPEDWQRMMNIQLNGTFYCCQAAGRQMVKQGWGGCIVNITSVTAQAAFPQRASYCTAKAGVDMLTKVLAIEWAQYKIRVNAVGPSHTETDMTRTLAAQGLYDIGTVSKRIPMGRLASVDDIANGVSFLCSEKASFITGQALYVDGGYLAYGYF
ncbi:MAG: SDR family oxidoreductase [Chloroflexi bacterium]|nr:SDR family oxidoreductase [Chloroflexota bacterium]MCL5275914.1 SDR family oxidoreductase [Chloroflexota bacterium]